MKCANGFYVTTGEIFYIPEQMQVDSKKSTITAIMLVSQHSTSFFLSIFLCMALYKNISK